MSRPHRNRSSIKKCPADPRKPIPAPCVNNEHKLQRSEQSQRMKELNRHYHGQVPVRVLYQMRGEHLRGVVSG